MQVGDKVWRIEDLNPPIDESGIVLEIDDDGVGDVFVHISYAGGGDGWWPINSLSETPYPPA